MTKNEGRRGRGRSTRSPFRLARPHQRHQADHRPRALQRDQTGALRRHGEPGKDRGAHEVQRRGTTERPASTSPPAARRTQRGSFRPPAARPLPDHDLSSLPRLRAAGQWIAREHQAVGPASLRPGLVRAGLGGRPAFSRPGRARSGARPRRRRPPGERPKRDRCWASESNRNWALSENVRARGVPSPLPPRPPATSSPDLFREREEVIRRRRVLDGPPVGRERPEKRRRERVGPRGRDEALLDEVAPAAPPGGRSSPARSSSRTW